jgi:hypothetical protein
MATTIGTMLRAIDTSMRSMTNQNRMSRASNTSSASANAIPSTPSSRSKPPMKRRASLAEIRLGNG